MLQSAEGSAGWLLTRYPPDAAGPSPDAGEAAWMRHAITSLSEKIGAPKARESGLVIIASVVPRG